MLFLYVDLTVSCRAKHPNGELGTEWKDPQGYRSYF